MAGSSPPRRIRGIAGAVGVVVVIVAVAGRRASSKGATPLFYPAPAVPATQKREGGRGRAERSEAPGIASSGSPYCLGLKVRGSGKGDVLSPRARSPQVFHIRKKGVKRRRGDEDSRDELDPGAGGKGLSATETGLELEVQGQAAGADVKGFHATPIGERGPRT